MEKQIALDTTLSTAQAAQMLRLSQHQVTMLASSGEIASSRIGHMLVLDGRDVLRYDQNRCGKGRPLSQDVALAALWILSNMDVPWLDYQQNRRLAAKLTMVSPDELVWQCRRRCEIMRFRCNSSFLAQVGQQISLSGCSSPFASQLGLSSLNDSVEGYVRKDMLEKIVASSHLKEDWTGNVVLRIVSGHKVPLDLGPMPIAVAAADLAESLVARERHAGLTFLKGALDEYRTSRTQRSS